MSKKVVYAATHSWHSPVRVGSHHYAAALAKGSDLLYLPHPVSIASVLSRKENQLRKRIDTWRAGTQAIQAAGLHEANWIMPFCPGASALQQTTLSIKHGWRLCWPNPVQFFTSSGHMSPDELWLDSLFQNFWVDILKPSELNIRIADHPAYITHLSSRLRRKLYETLNEATLIVTPTKAIAEYLGDITTSEIRQVPNGADINHFTKQAPKPKEYSAKPGPHVVFVGALASWIDLELVRKTAELCPEFTFWLIGPNHSQDTSNRPANLNYLGSIPYEEIPAFLQHASAAMAPFNVAAQPEFIASIDAIKIYEYIASGTPVVATRWEQSERLVPYVIPTDQTARAFRTSLYEAIENADAHTADAAYVNSIDWRTRTSFLTGLDSGYLTL